MKQKLISIKAAATVGLSKIAVDEIFMLSGTAIMLTWHFIIAFLLVGFMAIVVALEIGEPWSIIPKQRRASYSYVYETFGSELGSITVVLLWFSFSGLISVVMLGIDSYSASILTLSVIRYSSYFTVHHLDVKLPIQSCVTYPYNCLMFLEQSSASMFLTV